ncbi:MAG: aminomethyl-transferring glycine dehydrogenase subunit GcvPA [Prevotellaceae bacterium]|nr:aminomethyl-transferring glycine dehydrogenase subunit GcvPA [Candidatus Faecinaster equi]
MAYKYFPHTQEDLDQMLKVAGVKTLADLYAEVPEQLKLKGGYNIPSEMSELEIRNLLNSLGAKNKQLVCFAGAGAYDHYTPAVINYITQRSEFLTSYTPYQAEISQGTLQYIFEYQTLMADLTGMDVSNASMYDGATATAEAMIMAVASARKRDKVLISSTVNPAVIRVAETYAKYHGIDLQQIPAVNGQTDFAWLKEELAKGETAGVIVAQPNYYGIVEDFTGVADMCHENKALFIVNAPASTLAVLRTPGEWGADIAVGDAQSLGIPVSFGGPYLGYFCVKEPLLRKMPGRIVGGTTDTKGNRTFVLTMQAREQHIRRQKATSNICSNQGLMTLFVTIYMSLMGPEGLKEVNELSYDGAHYLYDELIKTGKFTPAFEGTTFFNEFCVKTTLNVDKLQESLADKGFLCGVKPEGVDNAILFAVTEQRSKAEIDKLVSLIKEA